MPLLVVLFIGNNISTSASTRKPPGKSIYLHNCNTSRHSGGSPPPRGVGGGHLSFPGPHDGSHKILAQPPISQNSEFLKLCWSLHWDSGLGGGGLYPMFFGGGVFIWEAQGEGDVRSTQPVNSTTGPKHPSGKAEENPENFSEGEHVPYFTNLNQAFQQRQGWGRAPQITVSTKPSVNLEVDPQVPVASTPLRQVSARRHTDTKLSIYLVPSLGKSPLGMPTIPGICPSLPAGN